MASKSKYILDANIFIEAKRRYYAFDLCPGFWDSLIYHNSIGNLESIDHVGKELSEGDALAIWKKKASSLFTSTDNIFVIEAYRNIIKWALTQDNYSEPEKHYFANDVDAWVIAYAKVSDGTVVTHEVSAPNSSKIKIPDVCKHFDIPYTNTFVMLKKLEIVFNWEK